ncbi:MAG: methionyl-tRNA formyltransferase [Hyphomicrobiaceae bacterium]
MRVVFMGTPEIAVPTLSETIGAGHDVVAVYSQPPRPAGRGMATRKSPVHAYAEAAGLPVCTPRSLKGATEQAAFRDHEADVAVVVAYGLLLPKAVLAAPRYGCLNMHGSALPRWRGAAPIQRAIMAGDTETAAMVMRMDEGLDTGPICLAERIEIGPDTTAGELHDRMMLVGAGLMVRALAALERGSLVATPQPTEGVTYAAKIDKSETRIDLSRSATEVHNRIRGLSPFPGAWLEAGPDGKRERIKVLRSAIDEAKGPPGRVHSADGPVIACGTGAIRLVEVQRAGKRPMSGAELVRGFDLGQL